MQDGSDPIRTAAPVASAPVTVALPTSAPPPDRSDTPRRVRRRPRSGRPTACGAPRPSIRSLRPSRPAATSSPARARTRSRWCARSRSRPSRSTSTRPPIRSCARRSTATCCRRRTRCASRSWSTTSPTPTRPRRARASRSGPRVVGVSRARGSEGRKLVHIGIKGYDVAAGERPRANLVFLIDTSGSMDEPNRLPLVKQSLALLRRRSCSPTTASRSSPMRAAPARCSSRPPASEKAKILGAIERLGAGGSHRRRRGHPPGLSARRAELRSGPASTA